MKYENIKEGRFISRPNRFISITEIDGKEEVCHVKTTGRCKELLLPGAVVYVEESNNPLRKTKYSLISVKKNDTLVNIDSSAPNKIFYEWLEKSEFFGKEAKIRPECKYKSSRFDFYIESQKNIFVEVKGVTLEKEGLALFPDAPTVRGVKHLYELRECIKEGFEAYIVFIIQMKGVSLFAPNTSAQPEFTNALKQAAESDVKILALDCIVTENSITADKQVSMLKQW